MEFDVNKLKILDGGSGCESMLLCKDKAEIESHKCWSSKLLYDDQNLVRQVYRRFINAGSEVITSLSYQANPLNLSSSFNISIDEAEHLLMDSVLLAKEEIRRAQTNNKSILVAASVGPYGAHLGDGSEYSGNYINNVDIQAITDTYRHMIQVLVKSDPDLLAFETIPTIDEVKIIIELMSEYPNVKAWISMSSSNGLDTVHGDKLSDVVDLVNKTNSNVFGFGVNCSINLLSVREAIRRIRLRLNVDKVVVLYPNNGEQFNEGYKNGYFPDGINENTFYDLLPLWIEEGARWIGGCCKMGSKEMVRVAEIIANIRKQNLVMI